MKGLTFFLLFLTGRTADGSLLTYPTDRTATFGERVILDCATDLDYPVYWYFNGHEIFYGGKVSMSFQSMFSVSSSKTGEYNLVISSADTSYNGLYACGDDEGQGEKKSAHLYVTAATVTVAATGGATDGDVNTGMISGTVVAIIVVLLLAIILITVAVYLYKRRADGRQKRLSVNHDDEIQLQPNGGDVEEVKEHVVKATDLTEREQTPSGKQDAEGRQSTGNGRTSPEDRVIEEKYPGVRARVLEIEKPVRNRSMLTPMSRPIASVDARKKGGAEQDASITTPSYLGATSDDSGHFADDAKYGVSSVIPRYEHKEEVDSPAIAKKENELNTTPLNGSKHSSVDPETDNSDTNSPGDGTKEIEPPSNDSKHSGNSAR